MKPRAIGEPADKAPAEDVWKQGEKTVENGRQLHLSRQWAFPPGCGTCAKQDVSASPDSHSPTLWKPTLLSLKGLTVISTVSPAPTTAVWFGF